MKIENLKLSDLKPDPEWMISRPADPGLHEIFLNRSPGVPPVIADMKKRVIAGYDSIEYLQNKGEGRTDVLLTDIGRKDSFFLAYHSRAALKPLSLYEKLCFLRSVLAFSGPAEIYSRTAIGIRIDDRLIEALPFLASGEFAGLLSDDGADLRTAVRLCRMGKDDRESFMGVLETFRFSSSNQQILMDTVEEICFRDKSAVSTVFNDINIKKLKEEGEDGNGVIANLFRVRYPEYSEYQRRWKDTADRLKFPYRFSLKHPVFFEKKGVELKLHMDSLEDALDLSKKLEG